MTFVAINNQILDKKNRSHVQTRREIFMEKIYVQNFNSYLMMSNTGKIQKTEI